MSIPHRSIPAILGILLAASTSLGVIRAGSPAELEYERSTGDFRISASTSRGLLEVSGTLGDGVLDSSATLLNTGVVYHLHVVEFEGGHDVTVSFGDLGEMRYVVTGDGQGVLINSTVTNCATLAEDDLIQLIEEAFDLLTVHETAWQNDPHPDDRRRAVTSLLFFLGGTDFVEDCQSRMRPHDTWGCDPPFEGLSCTDKGKCCDEHDECYRNRGCTKWSWIFRTRNCDVCNAEVVFCMTFRRPGPSECCRLDKCGDPRTTLDVDLAF